MAQQINEYLQNINLHYKVFIINCILSGKTAFGTLRIMYTPWDIPVNILNGDLPVAFYSYIPTQKKPYLITSNFSGCLFLWSKWL